MSSMIERITNWFTVEPAISLLMIITAVVLVGSALSRSSERGTSFWPWLRRLIEASVGAVMFLGLLWAFRSILNDNIQTFNSTHGSLTEANRSSAQSIWGRPHVQQDLIVAHYIDIEVKEEVPREDPAAAPVYRTTIERRRVPQNSITGFQGQVEMQLSEREKGYALYAGYFISSKFQYEIINDSKLKTEAEFVFPLSPGQTLHKEFKVLLDEKDISGDLRFENDRVSWMAVMQPGQESQVNISYSSRGMDYFYYQIPIQREIKDFELVVTIDRLPVHLLNYPERVLTPTDIQPTDDDRGSILTWNFDRAITVAGMGVALLQPEQPGADVLRVLWSSPYALTLLATMLALTFIIWGRPVQFLDLALVGAVYCVQFLLMASISDFLFGFLGSILVGALLTMGLAILLFRRIESRKLRWIIYLLTGFFTIVYPLSGLLQNVIQRNAFDNLVLVGMIIYLFSLALSRSSQKKVEISG